MKRIPLLQKLLTSVLAAVVVMLVSVREVHFLFTEHPTHHEDCHNHLHAADEHFHCEACKAHVSCFTDEVKVVQLSSPGIRLTDITERIFTFSYSSVRSLPYLRGPPVVA